MYNDNFMKLLSLKTFIIIILTVIAGAVFFIFYNNNKEAPAYCTMEAKLCSDGSYVGRVGSDCEFAACPKEDLIFVENPRAYEEISSPMFIKGKARGVWFFEGDFPIRLENENGETLAIAIATAKDEWMTTDFVDFEAKLDFPVPVTQNGYLVFERDNPSGLPENSDELNVPVVFSQYNKNTRNVDLYYYNPTLDNDKNGNILCSRKGLTAVERVIPLTQTPIQDTIKLLLRGELSRNEHEIGIGTEYPIEGFSLKNASLKNGVLTLEFDDSENKTVGGACRTGVLWFQIEATAKQFPEVREVRFLPEDIFQP